MTVSKKTVVDIVITVQETGTPRTDAKVFPTALGSGSPVVSADFARTLERELTAAREEIEELRKVRDEHYALSHDVAEAMKLLGLDTVEKLAGRTVLEIITEESARHQGTIRKMREALEEIAGEADDFTTTGEGHQRCKQIAKMVIESKCCEGGPNEP